MHQNATSRYAEQTRSHQELSIEQLNAIDLLLTGATDQFVADAIRRHRVTVTRWRLYHPYFRAELFRRRRDAYGGAVDGLRTVIPVALDTLRDQLRVGSGRGHIALSLLHKAGLTKADVLSGKDVASAQDDDQILDEIVEAEVRRRRAEILSEDPDEEFAVPPTAPVTQEDRQAALEYLLSRAAEPDPEPSTAAG